MNPQITTSPGTGTRRVARTAALVGLAAAALPAVGLASAHAAPAGPTAYTVNFLDNTVTPVDLATNTALPAIAVGNGPNAIAITPNGAKAYVTNSAGHTVSPIRTATNTAGRKIKVGRLPSAIAITPNGATAYVVNSGSNSVTPIATATNKPGAPIPVGSDPTAIAITPNGAKVYVSNLGSNTVTPINTATNKPGRPIAVGRAPGQIVITPNGRTAFVLDTYIHASTIRPIHVATNRAGKAIKVGKYPHDMVITPDGSTAFIACFDVDVPPGSPGAGSVVPLDVRTRAVGQPISFGSAFPNYLVSGPRSAVVYVTSELGVTPIRVASRTAAPAIPAGNQPWDIALNRSGRRAYVTDIGSPNAPVGKLTVLRLHTPKTVATVPVGLRPVAVGLTR